MRVLLSEAIAKIADDFCDNGAENFRPINIFICIQHNDRLRRNSIEHNSGRQFSPQSLIKSSSWKIMQFHDYGALVCRLIGGHNESCSNSASHNDMAKRKSGIASQDKTFGLLVTNSSMLLLLDNFGNEH